VSKNKIQLRFPNLHVLWSFAQSIKSTSLEIDTAHKLLTCYCTESEISLAIEKFNAEVVPDAVHQMNGLSKN